MSGIMNMFVATKTTIATAVDAFFNSVTLLLNTSSTNGAQNNTFLDSSTNNFTITRNGNTTQGSFTPFSQTGWSNNFVSSAALSVDYTANLQLQNTNWTIESYFNLSSASAEFCVMGASNGGGGVPKYFMGGNWSTAFGYNANRATFFTYTAGASRFIDVPFTWQIGRWYHMAAVYTHSNTTTTLYIDGVSVGSISYGIDNCTGAVLIARNGEGGGILTGYISNFRYIVGTSLYTSNFTPSTVPLTATTNTQILTCQSNRFVDNSASNRVINIFAAGVSVQAFSPFLPTAAYDSSVVGGSGYFDGTGDYLTIGSGTDFSLGTSDFAMEYWYYLTEYSTYAPGIFCKRTGGVATGWTMLTSGFVCLVGSTWYDSWGTAYWVGSSASTGFNNSTSTTKKGQWVHVLATRQGTNARWFVNGQLIGYQSRSGAIDQLTGVSLAIGFGGATAEQPYTGYISNGRIVIGSIPTGYQTSSTTLNEQIFTPPTAPVTATSQGATSGDVKLLFSATNAGIYDSASKNDLETVGNAQVSTTQAKWGTTSMYFDGTGDYAKFQTTSAANYNFTFGSSDFTIEMWVYPSNTSTVCMLVGQSDNATIGGGSFLIRINGNVDFYSGGTAYTCTGASPSVNQWSHIAYVRNGTSLKTYLNGTQVGTATLPSSTTSMNVGSTTYPPVLGAYSDGSGAFTGYIDDLRISKFARYTTTFTPPTTAFPLQ